MKHTTTKSHDIEIGEEDVAYIKLPAFERGKIKSSIKVSEIVKEYKGCDVILDFLQDGTLAGIEIIA